MAITLTKKYRNRILKLAIAIRDHGIDGLGFNLGSWSLQEREPGWDKSKNPNFCGTTACIAGWAQAASFNGGGKAKVRQLEAYAGGYTTPYVAAKYLGLGEYSEWRGPANELFMGVGRKFRNLENVTAEQAVATLTKLAVEGKVDWQADVRKWAKPETFLAA